MIINVYKQAIWQQKVRFQQNREGSEFIAHKQQFCQLFQQKLKYVCFIFYFITQTSDHDDQKFKFSKSKNNSKNVFKKNTETNLCTQILSFLTLQSKSQSILNQILRSFDLSQTVSFDFYQHMSKIKGIKTKYVNKKKILQIYRSKIEPQSSLLSRSLFKKLMRVLIKIYLQKCCTKTILTSKKMFRKTWQAHLDQRRQIYNFFMKQIQQSES